MVHAQAAERMTGLRSRVGGMARLQKAIVLDSVGRSGEAKELYTALKSHPHGDLAKRARRLLFGFQVRLCCSCMGNFLLTVIWGSPGWICSSGALERLVRASC